MRRSMMGRKKKYIIKDGVLMDQSIEVTTAKYGSQWQQSGTHSMEYRDGYIYFRTTWINRSAGIVFKPQIVNDGYSRLVVEADIKYGGDPHNGVILGTTYGSTSNWVQVAMAPTDEGMKYKVSDCPYPDDNKFTFDIRGVTDLFVFVGFATIANPSKGCVANLYNMYLTR